MSKVPDFLMQLSKAMGPGVTCIHNVSGGPVVVYKNGRGISVFEFTVLNGLILEDDSAIEPIRSWNTHERNIAAIVSYRDRLLKNFNDNGRTPGEMFVWVRETVEPWKDGRGVLKRPKVWKCCMLCQPPAEWPTEEPVCEEER